MKIVLHCLVYAVVFFFNVDGYPELKQSDNTIVKVSQGIIQGRRVVSDRTGGQYNSFRGIPYARPPIGNLRFQAPSEAPSWTGIRNATFLRSICLQVTNGVVQGSEDCLYLNVFVPQSPSGSGGNLLPVMVWIHGGGFTQGSGNDDNYYSDYLVDKGVILVTLNYRLGVLGFLGLNNSRMSANNGLKDQMAALKWVQANIEQFGGNKDQVTIFGESAGGGSVAFQIVSPATKGLFHRAISESGNTVDSWAYYDPSMARERAFRFGQRLGITTENEDTLIDFMMEVPAERLAASQVVHALYQFSNIEFRPTKESRADAFLPDSPVNIMKAGSYQQVPYITGFNSAETKLFLLDYLHNDTLWTELSMEQFVPAALNLPLGSPESLRLANEIKNLYFGNDTPTVQNIEGLVNVFSDAYFVSGVRRSANFHLRTSSAPVYVYQFSYVGSLSMSQYRHYGYPYRGAAHSDEVDYLFNRGNVTVENNSTEFLILQYMTTVWTNFAKTGNPSEGLNFYWEALTTSRQMYLEIDDELTIQNLDDLYVDRFALWDRIYASIDD